MKTIFIIEAMLRLVSPLLHVPIKTVEFINTTEAAAMLVWILRNLARPGNM